MNSSRCFNTSSVLIVVALFYASFAIAGGTDDTVSVHINSLQGANIYIGPESILETKTDTSRGYAVPAFLLDTVCLKGKAPLTVVLAEGEYVISAITTKITPQMSEWRQLPGYGYVTYCAGTKLDFRGSIKKGCLILSKNKDGKDGQMIIGFRDNAVVLFGKIVRIKPEADKTMSVDLSLP